MQREELLVAIAGINAAGSSIDEKILAGKCSDMAAHKMGRSQAEMWIEVMRDVTVGLMNHQTQVKAVAVALLRDKTIRAPRLEKLLKGVKR